MRHRFVYFMVLILSLTLSSFSISQTDKATSKHNKNEKEIKIAFFFQPQFFYFDSKQNNTSGSEMIIRRAKFCFLGKVRDDIKFFYAFKSVDYGKAGDNSMDMKLDDAWIEFIFSNRLKMNVGYMKVPFSRHMQQVCKKLHGLDFHNYFLTNTGFLKHRDIGIMFRGLISNNKLDYRLAILNGKMIKGELGKEKHLRYVGRIGYNFFDAEPEFGWAGTYLGKRKVLSFGFSFDMEPGVGGSDGKSLYRGLAFDFIADIPLGQNGIVTTFNAYNFNKGTQRVKGSGFWADFGYRIKKIEPLVAIEYYKPDSGDNGKRTAILPGISYWIKEFDSNIKAEYGLTKMNNANEWDVTFIVQTQMAF